LARCACARVNLPEKFRLPQRAALNVVAYRGCMRGMENSMISRRDFMQATLAASALITGSNRTLAQAAAAGKLTQDQLLSFEAVGNVTLVHLTDIHGQLMPLYFREPSVNLGVGEARGRMPHITGAEFLKAFKLAPKSPDAYALTDLDFVELAKNYGRMGGLDRIATLVKAIRAERGDKMLLLDGGDTWTNSWTALKTNGQDMVDVMNLLKPDAMTGHWEFTLGEKRVKEIADQLAFPFLAQNMRDSEFEEPVFEAHKIFDQGGVKIAVIGQAFPYTPIANPRWMIPKWSFGIRDEDMRKQVEAVRAKGAQLVIVLSHNGFDVDHKMAGRVEGIDVILSGHTHDALPEVTRVGKTLIVASGSHGKFVSRLDLDVQGGVVKNFRYRLIPVFSDAITPDAEAASLIAKHRAPYEADLKRVLGKTNSLLYRRGNVAGTLDDMFCQAMLSERDAEISLSPGIRWGGTLLPGQDITFEDVTNACAVSYPNCYRMTMTGARLKEVMEDVADNLFNPDPYLQQGGDMVRTGGLGFTIDPAKPIGQRITEMSLLKSGAAIDASKDYVVAGWASINQDTQGPPIWDVVSSYLTKQKVVDFKPGQSVKVIAG
jgi:S-sulfosulfanyl-L-cysteine sulfohydrolase